MMEEISVLIDHYRAWLKDRTLLREINDHIEITTPFLDRHNDYIQIYARRDNGNFILTDGGATIEDLEMSGCALDSPKRHELLRMTLAGFGVTNDHGALQVQAGSDNFPLRKHNLIQAMLAVNDLFYLAHPYVASVFLEDVAAWLEELNIRFTPDVSFRGKTGYEHRFHFAIPKSFNAPERLLHAINNPTKDAAQSLAFSWIDTRDVRPSGSCAYAIINDREKNIPSGVQEALGNYEVQPILWSTRADAGKALAA